MRIVKILILVLAFMGIGNSAQAVTFDGTDWSPEYTTGITEVSLWTDQGILAKVDVYSLPHCIEEDMTGDPCVWTAHKRGNFDGYSFVKLGTETNRLTATIPNWTADILLDPNGITLAEIHAYHVANWPEVFAPISFESFAPISFETDVPTTEPVTTEPVQEMTTEELGMTVSEYEAQNTDPENMDAVIADIHADNEGVNTDDQGMDICDLEQCEDNIV